MERVRIDELMASSGVEFGTSGARGLVSAMTDRVCYAYTRGFLSHVEASGQLEDRRAVAIAGDLRPSTPRIMRAIAAAVRDAHFEVVDSGLVPSPAVALYGIEQRVPAIMVTGSHIPADRNGIKFNTPSGEITKADEAGMRSLEVDLPATFDHEGALLEPVELGPPDGEARRLYVRRWLDAFPAACLVGRTVGVYEHSGVARDLLVEVFEELGARVVRLGRSDQFVPVDTEAVRPEDVQLAQRWAGEHSLDCIVSTDGDADRPLISDERGRWLRGDVAGILTARFLDADAVVAPVSCNTALELCGEFARTERTRIGSPYVIEAMQRLLHQGAQRVVGYEANGGFLTASPLGVPDGAVLAPLPTRDPVIVHLSVLLLAVRARKPVSEIAASLPARFTASDRARDFPTELARAQLAQLEAGGSAAIRAAFAGNAPGAVERVDTTDGFRIHFAGGDVVHFRPSGNAPELRCYTEADSEARADQLVRIGLGVIERWRS